MMSPDFYLILGVRRGESQRGIRDAYRHLARRYHPDRAGEQSTSRFQQIVEAYQVLSDPHARLSYDRGLEHAERRPRPQAPIVISQAGSTPLTPAPLRPLREVHLVEPSLEELLERIERNFSGLGVPRSERLSPVDLTLVLSPEEATHGGLLRFSLPVYYPCPSCHGAGGSWPFSCAACSGHGAVIEQEEVAIDVPPLVEDGSIFELPLRGLGIHNLYLRVWTRVAG